MSNIFNDPNIVYLITTCLTHDEMAVANQVNKMMSSAYCDFLNSFHVTLIHRKNHGSILAMYPDPSEERPLRSIDERKVYEVKNAFGYIDGIILDCWERFRIVHNHRVITATNDRFNLKALDSTQPFLTSSIWCLVMTLQNGGWVARRDNSLYFSNVENIVYEIALADPIDLERDLIVDISSDDYDDMSVSSERSITGYEPIDKKARVF